jgi:glycosyltransferase involved in cell wall biosynthesis
MAAGSSPFISVVVNNHNYARFLDDAISSSLSQSYPDKEVIVVDDGSTDNSREVIDRYGGQVVPIYKGNGGQGSTMNAAFPRARGDLILFLDSDDMLEPGVLAAIAQRWDGKATKISYRLDVIDNTGEVIGQNPDSNLALPEGDIRASLIRTGHYVSPPSSGNCYSRAYLSAVLPMPEEVYRRAADSYLFTLAPLHGEIMAVPQVGGKYRMHGANGFLKMRRNSSAKDLLGALQRHDRCLGLIRKFVEERGLDYTYTRKYYPDIQFTRLLYLRIENQLGFVAALTFVGNILYGTFANKSLRLKARLGWIAKTLLVAFAPLPLVWRFYPNTRPAPGVNPGEKTAPPVAMQE